ncbi:MAG: hypothetical protein JW993_16075 [Sedimentisphaerales bacterium]|nr:hypothetical protein [Sedimentisphaerales bacterium]
MNDDEKYIGEFVKDIPFEDADVGHRDTLKAQLLNAYPSRRAGMTGRAAVGWHGKSMMSVGKLVAAAVILLALAALAGQLTAMFSGGSVVWADVAAKFQTVPSFNATIYIKEQGAADEPEQMELWWSRGGRMRVRFGTQVIFAVKGQVVRAYDIETRQQVDPSDRVAGLLARVGRADEFSLNAVIDIMFGGAVEDVTPLVNPDVGISRDLVVFDIDMPGMDQWARIWALRESRLPMRIRVWDPRDGAATDVFFEYSKGQDAEFFDAGAFGALLTKPSSSGSANVAYAFLKDPGGQSVTPEEMFEKSGYHLPVVKRAGMTDEGAFWVLADKGLNQRASGSVFYGFARIADDLGRTYVKATWGYHGNEDTSLDIFVPIDFPFDQRRPARITLVCSPRQVLVGNTPDEIVGTVELTTWEPNAPCPELHEGLDADVVRLKMTLARDLFGRPEHAERLERLLQAIPNWNADPRDTSLLLFWQEVTCRMRDFQETLKIGRVLTPLLLVDASRTSRYHFTEHIVALAATGQLDEAKRLFRQIDALDDMSPKKSDNRYYSTYLEQTVRALAGDAALEVAQISEVLGLDITQHRRYEQAAEQARRNALLRQPATAR